MAATPDDFDRKLADAIKRPGFRRIFTKPPAKPEKTEDKDDK